MTIDTTTAPVTRFDVRETEEGDEVRLFHKRSLVGRFSTDEIARGDDWEAQLEQFIGAGQHNYTACEAFLTSEADDEVEGDEDEEGEVHSIVPPKYRILYGAEQNCGDDVAQVLTAHVTTDRASKKNPDGGLDRAKLRAVAEINGIGHKLADWEDRGLNGGLLRMNTSNVLRGMVRRGERVEIGSTVWEADPSKLEARKEARKAAKKSKKTA